MASSSSARMASLISNTCVSRVIGGGVGGAGLVRAARAARRAREPARGKPYGVPRPTAVGFRPPTNALVGSLGCGSGAQGRGGGDAAADGGAGRVESRAEAPGRGQEDVVAAVDLEHRAPR